MNFLGVDGHRLLLLGIGFCLLGLFFGLSIYRRLKNLPTHPAMRAISDLIYETCKTYLVTQGKFLLLLEAFVAAVIVRNMAVTPDGRVYIACSGVNKVGVVMANKAKVL